MPSTAAAPRKRRAYAPRVPAGQRRTQLLDGALHLVATRGHRSVTMEAVAEQAGVTKPVVYGVFANRAELLAALLQREQEQALAQLLAVLPDPAGSGPGDPAELMTRVLDGFLAAVRAAPDRWHCIVMPMPDLPTEFHLAREQARDLLLVRAEELARSVLRELAAPADLDPEIVAHTVITLAEMAARLVLTDPGRFRADRFTSALRAAIGLVRPSPGHSPAPSEDQPASR